MAWWLPNPLTVTSCNAVLFSLKTDFSPFVSSFFIPLTTEGKSRARLLTGLYNSQLIPLYSKTQKCTHISSSFKWFSGLFSPFICPIGHLFQNFYFEYSFFINLDVLVYCWKSFKGGRCSNLTRTHNLLVYWFSQCVRNCWLFSRFCWWKLFLPVHFIKKKIGFLSRIAGEKNQFTKSKISITIVSIKHVIWYICTYTSGSAVNMKYIWYLKQKHSSVCQYFFSLNVWPQVLRLKTCLSKSRLQLQKHVKFLLLPTLYSFVCTSPLDLRGSVLAAKVNLPLIGLGIIRIWTILFPLQTIPSSKSF